MMNPELRKGASYEGRIGEVKKVILLYSGGLDSSVILRLIQDQYRAEVITLTADVGGLRAEELELIRKRALTLGATKAHVVDLRSEFANDYISKAIKANGLYESKYPLVSALSRYPMCRSAVELAGIEGADTCAHGCTGKGNSQIRFDLSITTLNPNLKILAPIRDYGITRDKEVEYAEASGIPTTVSSDNMFSVDENLWGRGIASGSLEDPEEEPPSNILKYVTPPEDAPDEPEYVTLQFNRGIPVVLNGQELELDELIGRLNIIAGKNGVGLIDHVEDRAIGLKSRDLYECPAALTLIEAHRDLEKFTSTFQEITFKEMVDSKWAQLAYLGLWYDPLMDALNSFIDTVNLKVTGQVRVKLYKGSLRVVGRSSEFALYDKNQTTYLDGVIFNQGASTGFIEHFGHQMRAAYALRQKVLGLNEG